MTVLDSADPDLTARIGFTLVCCRDIFWTIESKHGTEKEQDMLSEGSVC